METEILTILSEIKIAIYLLIAIVILGVIANWIRTGLSLKNVIREGLNDIFTEEASNYYDEGNFEELFKLCEKKLKKKPNHSYALWYKAKAYYLKKEYKKAKVCFEYLAHSEPSWDKSHIQPYLEKIEVIESENR